MTQEYRWLAALALLVAFGACTVRAEEEKEEVSPRPMPVAELLPAPRPSTVDASRMVIMPPALSAPAYPFLFPPPCPFACPTPISMGLGANAYGPTSPACPWANGACQCESGICPAPSGLWRPLMQNPNRPQYLVTIKMVKGGDGPNSEATTCPRVTVLDGEPATIHLQGYEKANERSSLQIQVTIAMMGVDAQMDLAMTEANSHDSSDSGLRSHTETTETRCSVPFGKPYKMELKQDAWLEVTVTQVEREEHVHQAACGGACRDMALVGEKDAEACPMDAAGEVIGCLSEILSDAMNSAFSWAFVSDEETEPTTLEQLPPYVPSDLAAPLPLRQVGGETARPCPGGCAGSCPKCESGCTQCSAVEAAQKPETGLCIDAMHDRKKVELTDGARHWKAEADRITVHGDCIQLQGNVVAESYDDSHHDHMLIKADAIRLERKDGGMKIQIEGGAKTAMDD